MKALLMHPSTDFDPKRRLPWNHEALNQDLGLNALFNAMAQGDQFLFDMARAGILTALENDIETILYRQAALRDCIENTEIVRSIYGAVIEAIDAEKKTWWSFGRSPGSNLYRANELLESFVGSLKRLRGVAEEHAGKFRSPAFVRLFAMLRKELDEAYLEDVRKHLKRTKFAGGVLIGARLGGGNMGTDYSLLKSEEMETNWWEWLFPAKMPGLTFELHPRDDAGARALSELRERGINLVANALAQSTDHILGFFRMLLIELGFYLGCLNLRELLLRKSEPLCFPIPETSIGRKLSARGLYDVCLSLNIAQRTVGNDLNADGKELILVTGANQGGKSTFLRSVGIAQLMMQAGMFAPGETFRAELCDGLFTHFKREEDVEMKSGKLDEELERMSGIVDHLTTKPVLLFNESFAATNEREGSEIARQIVCALLEKPCRVLFVTHLYDLAISFHEKRLKNALFLRAERRSDGARTFRIIEGEPLETSYGQDLYRQIFNRPQP